MADPAFVGNIFIMVSIGIASGIVFLILLRMIGALGGGE
jgi:hypothetical protein